MKSGTNIRHSKDGEFDTNLIVCHCFVNIFHQTIYPLDILSISQESQNLPLFCQLG